MQPCPVSVYLNQSDLVCAIGATTEERLGALSKPPQKPEQLSFTLVGENVSIPYHAIPSLPVEQIGRLYALIDQVMEGFMEKIALPKKELKRAALFFGSTSYDIGQSLAQSRIESKPVLEHLTPLSTLPNYIKKTYHIDGLNYAYNSACSSSANALRHAKLLLEQNIIDHAIVVGCELYNPASIGGFYSLQLLSPNACQPFTQSDGMALGEAVGAILLSKEKCTANLELVNAHASVDAINITGANESGSTLKAVMEGCVQGFDETITAIKTCGVGTSNADRAELNGIRGMNASELGMLAFKPYLGNTLGASGVAELILLNELLSLDSLPKGIFVDDFVPLTLQGQSVLLNSFGFGGNNVCLLVKHHAA